VYSVIGIAADAIDAQTQFQRPVFQARRLDEKSGHANSKFLDSRLCDFKRKMSSRKMNGWQKECGF